MKMVDKILVEIGMKEDRLQRKIKVRFPDWTGDTDRAMSIQELKDSHSGCLLINPERGESVTIDEIETLDLREVIAMPPIQGG